MGPERTRLSAMRLGAWLCGIPAAAALRAANLETEPAGGQPRRPGTVGIIAVAPKHFTSLQAFLWQWRSCKEGMANMDVLPIFSNLEDSADFTAKWIEMYGVEDKPWEPAIADSLGPGKNPASWKKLFGLAYVLQRLEPRGYEYALMLDAEISLNNCTGFVDLLPRLRAKHARHAWYGEIRSKGRLHINTRLAASTIPVGEDCFVGSPCTRAKLKTNPKECSVDCPLSARIRNASKNFGVYTWSNDIPFVNLEAGRRMFDHWAGLMPQPARGASVEMARLPAPAPRGARSRADAGAEVGSLANVSYGGLLRRLVFFGVVPSPEDIAAAMGTSSETQLFHAGEAFEHLIYQFHTMAYDNFSFVDLTPRMARTDTEPPGLSGASLGERFWWLPPETQKVYLDAVEPLWLPNHVPPNMVTPGGPVLLLFHMDRPELEGPKVEPLPEMPEMWKKHAEEKLEARAAAGGPDDDSTKDKLLNAIKSIFGLEVPAGARAHGTGAISIGANGTAARRKAKKKKTAAKPKKDQPTEDDVQVKTKQKSSDSKRDSKKWRKQREDLAWRRSEVSPQKQHRTEQERERAKAPKEPKEPKALSARKVKKLKGPRPSIKEASETMWLTGLHVTGKRG